MTLDRLSERIAEANNKVDKVDGRRFNSRSQMKMKWEMRGISRSINKARKRSSSGLHRGLYTEDEMEEYRVEQTRTKERNSDASRGQEDEKEEDEKEGALPKKESGSVTETSDDSGNPSSPSNP